MRITVRVSERLENKIEQFESLKFGEESVTNYTRGYIIGSAYDIVCAHLKYINWKEILETIGRHETNTKPTTINLRQDVLRAIDDLVSLVVVEFGEKNIYRATAIELIICSAIMLLENRLPYKKVSSDDDGKKYNNNLRYNISLFSIINVLTDMTYKAERGIDKKVIEPLLDSVREILNNSEYVQKTYDITGNDDNSALAYNFYHSFFKEEFEIMKKCEIRFSGETMCSLGTTFGETNKQGKFERLIDGGLWKRSYTHDMTVQDENLFYLFREGYHKVENYIFLPSELNRWRGKEDKGINGLPNQGDYFDIFLELIRNWYCDKINNSEAVNVMLNKHKEWLISSGEGEEGWKNFVVHNMCKPLVNVDFTVKDIFSPPSEYNQSMAPVVGTYHSYGNALTQHTNCSKQSAMNYVKNSLEIWKKRRIGIEEAFTSNVDEIL